MKKFNVKEKLKKLIKFLLDWRTAISFFIAWMITNGWSYVCLGIGIFLDIKWMIAVGSAYLAFLWLPFTPEKLITIPIAVGLKKLLFRRRNKILKNKVKGCLVLSQEELKLINSALYFYGSVYSEDTYGNDFKKLKDLQEKIKGQIEKEK